MLTWAFWALAKKSKLNGFACPGKSWENFIFSSLLKQIQPHYLFSSVREYLKVSDKLVAAMNSVFETFTDPQNSWICALGKNKDWWGISSNWRPKFLNSWCHTGASYQRKKFFALGDFLWWGGVLCCEYDVFQINSGSHPEMELLFSC